MPIFHKLAIRKPGQLRQTHFLNAGAAGATPAFRLASKLNGETLPGFVDPLFNLRKQA